MTKHVIIAVYLALVATTACRPDAPPVRSTVRLPASVTSSAALATVDGVAILAEDIDARIAMQVFRRQLDIYSLQQDEVQRLIDERLLSEEAKRRGVSVPALMADEVQPAKISDEEVDAYMKARGIAAERRPRVEFYLAERDEQAQRLRFMESLRSRANIVMHLKAPQPPRVTVPVDGAPSRGAMTAPVIIAHFASFTDRMSAISAKNLVRLMKEFSQIRWIHFDVLQRGDERALAAVVLGRLAQERGQFWPVHDALMAAGQWTLETIERLAASIDVSKSELDAARHAPKYLKSVRTDAERARRFGVPAPPVYFINGRYLSGTMSYDHLRSAVQEELQSATLPSVD
ncbi:MAG: thioredoxin domain-containing protein [Myxococcota bacterium]